jgi:hypothetical protein
LAGNFWSGKPAARKKNILSGLGAYNEKALYSKPGSGI